MTAPTTEAQALRSVTPDMLAAAWTVVRGRYPEGRVLGVGPGFAEAIAAALAVSPLLSDLCSVEAALDKFEPLIPGRIGMAGSTLGERVATIAAEAAAGREGERQWAERAGMAGEHDTSTLAGALAYLRPDPASNGSLSLRAPKAREAVKTIEAEIAALRSQDREDGAREVLRWAERDGGWWAYSAEIHVGFVVRRPAEGGGFEWAYEITAVFTKWIAKGHGATKSKRTAKAAVERAWAAWLDYAGLRPTPPEPRTDGGRGCVG